MTITSQFARQRAKLIEELDYRRGHFEPLMSCVTLNTQLFDDVEETSAHSICEHHTRTKDMSDVGDGCQPNKLRVLQEL